jgi:pilus assembly protein CpaC
LWAALAALAVWLCLAGSASAQEGSSRQIVVPRGGTISLEMASRKKIKAAETDVQGIVRLAISPKLDAVLITGENPGLSKLTVIDVDGGREMYDLIVQTDVQYLKFVLRQAVPTANIEPVPSANNAFVLTGTVQRAEDVAIVLATAQSIIGNNLINALVVGGVQQVQLDVVVATVKRNHSRTMAFSFIENRKHYFISSTVGGGGSLTNALATGVAASTASLTGNPNLIFGVLGDTNGFTGYLNALRNEGVAKFLAEPRLVTLSGRPAEFVSGGEQAVPTLASGSAGGGAVSGVDFRPFGTTVRFLPIVKGNGKIYLEVEPQISNPSGDPAIAAPVPGTAGVVNGRTTQRVQTSVLLEDGQTFAIGGLVQSTMTANATKVPILGDLPFLGAAFRSVNSAQTEEEVVILVTPHLVDALDCRQIPKFLPGQETRMPDDFELFLEGILEAPRGQRQVCEGLHYVPAFHHSPTYGQYPCGQGGCGFGHGNGNCGSGGCGYGSNCGSGGCGSGGCGAGNTFAAQGSILDRRSVPPVTPAAYQDRAVQTHAIPVAPLPSNPVAPTAPVPVNDNPAQVPVQLSPMPTGQQH